MEKWAMELNVDKESYFGPILIFFKAFGSKMRFMGREDLFFRMEITIKDN